MCYSVDTSFVYSIQHGRQVCSARYANSTPVRFHSQQWGNVNSTRFLGRTVDDVLLELFYYQLEKKLSIENTNNTKSKHWLRLLVGEKGNDNECALRYFIRSSGAFTILHQCSQGGHPVCQTQPIPITETKTSPPEIETTTAKPLSLPLNETADEDLANNETETNSIIDSQNTTTAIQTILPRSNNRFWLKIVILSLFMIILLITVIFVIRYLRRSHGSYSTHENGNSSSRIRSGIASSTSTSKTPAVLYTRLKSSPPSIIVDAETVNAYDNTVNNDDNIQLLAPTPDQTNSLRNTTNDDPEEEPYYATLKVPAEK